jgi:hypothetical protein
MGIPRSRIVCIAQCQDYLENHADGQFPKTLYMDKCARLISEGGVDYDFKTVNPATVLAVLEGRRSKDHHGRWGKTLPGSAEDCSAVVFAIYSHGDSHPTEAGGASESPRDSTSPEDLMDPMRCARAETVNPLRNEWFAHLPYPAPQDDAWASQLCDCVATAGAATGGFGRNKPPCYLYASQLQRTFGRMFSAHPARPVVALLNFCRAGGVLEFMRRPAARRAYGADAWPLFLMASAQAGHDALVGGLWDTFFAALAEAMLSTTTAGTGAADSGGGSGGGGGGAPTTTLGELFGAARQRYFQDNRYQLQDIICTHAYASNFGEEDETFPADLRELCAAGPGGEPDWEGMAELQRAYADGSHSQAWQQRNKKRQHKKRVRLWHPQRWRGAEVDLVEAAKLAQQQTAIPEAVWGAESGVDRACVRSLLA